jgi:hypothetical protein
MSGLEIVLVLGMVLGIIILRKVGSGQQLWWPKCSSPPFESTSNSCHDLLITTTRSIIQTSFWAFLVANITSLGQNVHLEDRMNLYVSPVLMLIPSFLTDLKLERIKNLRGCEKLAFNKCLVCCRAILWEWMSWSSPCPPQTPRSIKLNGGERSLDWTSSLSFRKKLHKPISKFMCCKCTEIKSFNMFQLKAYDIVN